MLKFLIEVKLSDSTILEQSCMLKVPHNTELYREHLSKWDMFPAERGMYQEIIPAMVELYKEVGVNLLFTPQPYKLSSAIQEIYILLEDLIKKGFRNVLQQDGHLFFKFLWNISNS